MARFAGVIADPSDSMTFGALARPLGGEGVPADGAGDGAQLSLVAVDDQRPRTFRHEERGRDLGRAGLLPG
jgi:hypothetical protein